MPNRAPELMWEEEVPDGSLTRTAIVLAAMEIADEEGLDAVSIRRVAAKLSARPMSLYTHIASKEDLIALMLNEAVAEVLLPEPLPDDWREALRAIAHRSYHEFLVHPWALEALGRASRIGPNLQRHAEQSEAAVAPLGLSRDDAWHVLRIVDAYTIGQAMTVASLERVRELHDDFDDVPDLPDAFEVGLETVLEGVEKRFVR